MKTITIKDENAAFSIGLRYYIQQSVTKWLKKDVSYKGEGEPGQINMLFLAVKPYVDCFLLLSIMGKGTDGIVFFIMDRPEDRGLLSARCLKYFPVIYRGDSLASIRDKILGELKIWRRAGYFEGMSSVCSGCGRLKLTENEITVIGMLAREYSLTETAWVLGKNVKTVYTQKKSAMNKLKLNNSHELRLFIINHRRVLSVL
ncbi:fimbriae regulatory protein FimW [Serratia marcescens]|uniref:hypothetical protein n=1 Tax=Serratia marcescens TaxID=615 RepID=UPI00217A3884|nr:hypothetical protein [Serratia marcescens]CAI1138060.1 fimbriae regulatory protein FimW [Serratia marcescens]CAI1145479.1 fimbriae regulatory protein FimW [Serratia marcescens]CAI1940246.1 fimbriae regulatory protein FimW [Serratia marcescens]CAI1998614.1 fimbriae regulatory protein FimW [Serratia marcescens]